MEPAVTSGSQSQNENNTSTLTNPSFVTELQDSKISGEELFARLERLESQIELSSRPERFIQQTDEIGANKKPRRLRLSLILSMVGIIGFMGILANSAKPPTEQSVQGATSVRSIPITNSHTVEPVSSSSSVVSQNSVTNNSSQSFSSQASSSVYSSLSSSPASSSSVSKTSSVSVSSSALQPTVSSIGSSASTQILFFANCSEAKAAGYSNISRGEPGYSSKLDRDNNGVACEQ